jgi:ATP-binding cassette, subfamily B, bacterial
MTTTCDDVSWPASRLNEALEGLARARGLTARTASLEAPPADAPSERLGPWIESAADWLGLEAEPVDTPYAEVSELLTRAGPALLRLPRDREGEARFVALAGSRGRRLMLLTPERTVQVAPAEMRSMLCEDLEAPVESAVEQTLLRTGLNGRRRQRAGSALTRQLLGPVRVGGCWLLRSAETGSLAAQARSARLPLSLAALLGVHAVEYVLWLASWWLLGWMTLQGRLHSGWLVAWALLLMAIVPCRIIVTALAGRIALRAGLILKRGLLAGALRLDPDAVRRDGPGRLLGRVIESQVVETAALTGGFVGLTAALALAISGVVLFLGAGGWIHVGMLLGTVVVTFLLALHYLRRGRRWTEQRVDMTDDLVEKMLGHRTRLAQEKRAHWNDGEDQALEQYLGMSAKLDGTAAALQVVIPRGWFLISILGLMPAFVWGGHTPGSLAVAVGGVMLATRALRQLTEGLEHLIAALIAWERVRPLLQPASAAEAPGQPRFAVPGVEVAAPEASPTNGATAKPPAKESPKAIAPLLEGRDLVFRYREHGDPVLQRVGISVASGERILLEGPSGGGKTTLAALLSGTRTPSSGLMLLDGLDRNTLGAHAWRRRVVLVPQFHDNHILMGSLAFNVLLGRGWPPQADDLEDAERICRALDLGPLLDRMPAGLQQPVGDTGWQLSHGEKSRVYIARALLQRPEVLILDESFAALDPETLGHTLAAVLARAPALVVIAHP